MGKTLVERVQEMERREPEFNIGDPIIITQSPKFKGRKAIIVEKNGGMFDVRMADDSIRKYSISAVKKDPEGLTQEEIDVILMVAMKSGCDRDGDILRIYVRNDHGTAEILKP